MTFSLLRYTGSYVLDSSYSPHLSAGNMSRLIVRKDLPFIYESVAFEMAITASTNLFGNKKKTELCVFLYGRNTIVDIVRLFSS